MSVSISNCIRMVFFYYYLHIFYSISEISIYFAENPNFFLHFKICFWKKIKHNLLSNQFVFVRINSHLFFVGLIQIKHCWIKFVYLLMKINANKFMLIQINWNTFLLIQINFWLFQSILLIPINYVQLNPYLSSYPIQPNFTNFYACDLRCLSVILANLVILGSFKKNSNIKFKTGN